MQVRVTQFNDLEFKNKGNKILIVEKVIETQEIFSMSWNSDSLGLWTQSYAFNEDTNLLIRKLYMQAKVYIQFQ